MIGLEPTRQKSPAPKAGAATITPHPQKRGAKVKKNRKKSKQSRLTSRSRQNVEKQIGIFV